MGQVKRLTEKLQLPMLDINEKPNYEIWRELIDDLEKLIGEQINVTVNYLLDQVGSTNEFYFGIPNDSGIYPTGTWRITTDEDGYSVEQFDGTDWVEKYNVTDGKLFTSGGIGGESVTVTEAYTIPDNVHSVYCDTTGGSFNVTLPTLTGKRFVSISVKDSGNNEVTLVGTINEVSNEDLYPGETLDLKDMETTWAA